MPCPRSLPPQRSHADCHRCAVSRGTPASSILSGKRPFVDIACVIRFSPVAGLCYDTPSGEAMPLLLGLPETCPRALSSDFSQDTCPSQPLGRTSDSLSRKWTCDLPMDRARSGRCGFEADLNWFALIPQVHRTQPFDSLRQQAVIRH